MPSKRVVISQAMFDRVWKEEILPDLNRRYDRLVAASDEATATADFLTAVRDVWAEFERVRELGSDAEIYASIDWAALVEPTQLMCWIARERCSTR